MSKAQIGWLWLALLLLTLLTLNSPGTSDMGARLKRTHDMEEFGVARGFVVSHADYPPLTAVIMLGAVRVGRRVGLEPFVAVKVSIGVFLLLTTLVTWRWTRDMRIAVAMFLALLLSSMLLAYVDVYYAPMLVLGLWALQEGRLALFSACFAVACLTKWQPLIIGPFLALFVLRPWGRHPRLGTLVVHGVLPAAAVLGLALGIFGAGAMWEAFDAGASHRYLSGNAFNFGWIMTHWLMVFSPERFGGVVNGQADNLVTSDRSIRLLPQLLFVSFYAASLGIFAWRREKTFANTLLFATFGLLAYFTFNVGVHENHLAVAVMLGVLLVWQDAARWEDILILALAFNINMYAFYGSSGQGLEFSRVLFERVDMALVLACFNVGFFLYWWGREALRPQAHAMNTLQQVGDS